MAVLSQFPPSDLAQLAAQKPAFYGTQGYVEFPGETGDSLQLAAAAMPVDPSVSWRVDVELPAPPAGPVWEWTSLPMGLRMSATNLTVVAQMTDATQPGPTVLLSALQAAGFPTTGGRVQIGGEWDTVQKRLRLMWRVPGRGNSDLANDSGWNQGASSLQTGKTIDHAAHTWFLGGSTASRLGKGRVFRFLRRWNDPLVNDVWTTVLDLDVNADVEDPAAVTITPTVGPVVTVNRSGTPATELVPAVRRGHSVGVGDWRLIIEQLTGSGFVWGAFKWGTVDPDTGLMPKWGARQWTDITDRVDGIDSFRGADEPVGRPRAGDMTVTLRNDDAEFDPWVNYANVRPGTVLRMGLVSAVDTRADGWLPRWTAIADDWPVEYHGVGALSRCSVSLTETVSLLAQHDENAVAAVGTGEELGPRIERLAAAAEFPFDVITTYAAFSSMSAATLQATTMAGNRLAEMYLTADSCTNADSKYRGIVRSDVTGALLVTNTADHAAPGNRLVQFSKVNFFGFDFAMVTLSKDPDGYNGDLFHADFTADSIVTGNNADGIWNDHRYARVGGTQQVVYHRVSAGRFRARKVKARGDLICQTDAMALRCARHDNNKEARTALRVEQITVELGSDRGEAMLVLAAMDVGDMVWLFPPAGVGFSGSGTARVRSISDSLLPGVNDVDWHVTLALDFTGFNDIPGAMLPVAP